MFRVFLTILTLLAVPVQTLSSAISAQSVKAGPPIVRVPPVFPGDAPPEMDEGWAIVEFSIDEKGNVENAHAVGSSHEAFEAPAVKAVKRWKYRPKREDGVAVRTDGVRTKVIFNRPPLPEPITFPLDLWQKRTRLSLSSGHTVFVMPPQVKTRGREVVVGNDGKLRRSYEVMHFVANVAFEFSSVSKAELRSMAREILEHHLSSTVKELEAAEQAQANGATIRFVMAMPGRPKPDTVLVKKHADIQFLRKSKDRWLDVYVY